MFWGCYKDPSLIILWAFFWNSVWDVSFAFCQAVLVVILRGFDPEAVFPEVPRCGLLHAESVASFRRVLAILDTALYRLKTVMFLVFFNSRYAASGSTRTVIVCLARCLAVGEHPSQIPAVGRPNG